MCAESFMTKDALLAANQQGNEKKRERGWLKNAGVCATMKNWIEGGHTRRWRGTQNEKRAMKKCFRSLLLLQIHDGERRQCK